MMTNFAHLPVQYDLPQRALQVASFPQPAKHFVPSFNSGWSNGIQSVFADPVNWTSSSFWASMAAKDSSLDLSFTSTSQA